MRNCGTQSVYLPIYIYLSFVALYLLSISLSACLPTCYMKELCALPRWRNSGFLSIYLSTYIYVYFVPSPLPLRRNLVLVDMSIYPFCFIDIYGHIYLCNFSLYYLSITYLHIYLYYEYLYL